MRGADRGRRLGRVLATGVALLAFAGGAVAQTTRPAEPPKAPSGQPPSTDQRSPLGTGAETQPKRSIMGTVKKVASDGLVIEEQKTDGGKGREWAFAIEPNTRTRGAKAGDPIKAADLKVGDRVVVAYDDRAGKVVAQTITRLDATQQR